MNTKRSVAIMMLSLLVLLPNNTVPLASTRRFMHRVRLYSWRGMIRNGLKSEISRDTPDRNESSSYDDGPTQSRVLDCVRLEDERIALVLVTGVSTVLTGRGQAFGVRVGIVVELRTSPFTPRIQTKR